MEDWRRDCGCLRGGDVAQPLCKRLCTSSKGEDVGESARASAQVAGCAVGERSLGTEIVKSRGPTLVTRSSGGRGIARVVFSTTRRDRGGGETWMATLQNRSLIIEVEAQPRRMQWTVAKKKTTFGLLPSASILAAAAASTPHRKSRVSEMADNGFIHT